MKTVKVRIPVAITELGDYCVWSSSEHSENDCMQESLYNVRDDILRGIVWIEAEVPLPEAVTVQGKVVEVEVVE